MFFLDVRTLKKTKALLRKTSEIVFSFVSLGKPFLWKREASDVRAIRALVKLGLIAQVTNETATCYSVIPISRTSKRNENWFEKTGIQGIECSTNATLLVNTLPIQN